MSIGTLGLALGAINLYYILQLVPNDIVGMRLDYAVPVGTVLALVPTILGAGADCRHLAGGVGGAGLAGRGTRVRIEGYCLV